MRVKRNLDSVIFDKLLDEIVAGKWKPGQQILIDELAEYFEVSRTPVIQATRMMAVEGLIHIKRNGRIEVRTFTYQQIQDIYEMRFVLEDYAIRTICDRKIELDRDKMDSILRKSDYQQNIKKDAVATRRCDLTFHKELVDSVHNECLESSYKMVQGLYMVANYLLITHDEKLQSKANADHQQIIDFLYQHNYTDARAALEKHIMDGCARVRAHMENEK